MDSPVTQVHLGHDNIRDFCIGIVHAVQAAREQQELVCSMRDDELGAKDDLSRGIALNSQGTVLQSCRIQSGLSRMVVTGSADRHRQDKVQNQIWSPF